MIFLIASIATYGISALVALGWIALGSRFVPMDRAQPRHAVGPRTPEQLQAIMPHGDGLSASPMIVIETGIVGEPSATWVSDEFAPGTSR